MNEDEINREEKMEEVKAEELCAEDEIMHHKERERKDKWLRLNKDKRIAVRRLHAMMGHCSGAALTRMLKSSLASKDVRDAFPFFRCEAC